LSILLNLIQTLFIPLGIYILLNRKKVADKAYDLSIKRTRSGQVTSVRWNKIILIPISITMVLYGFLNGLLVVQDIKLLV